MGNTESLHREYTTEQLKQYEKADIQLLSGFQEKDLLDDVYLSNKFLQELENNTRQYEADDLKIKRLKKNKEKWKNTEAALSWSVEGTQKFKPKELKWLKKELSTLSSLGSASFSTMLELRLNLLQRVNNALIRRNKRLKMGFPMPEDRLTQQKAEFIMNLYSNTPSKVCDVILSRLAELPDLASFYYIDENKPEEDKDKMDIDTSLYENTPNENEQIVDCNYDKEFSNHLVAFLVSTTMEETKQALSELKPDTPMPEGSQQPAPSPTLRLIQYVQRSILQDASVSLDINTRASKKLFLYSKMVLLSCVELIDLACKVNSSLIGNADATSAISLDPRICSILNQSPLCYLLHSLVSGLCLMINRSDYYHFASQLIPILAMTTGMLDIVNHWNPESRAAETNFQERLRLSNHIQAPIEVESPHNYYPNTDEEKIVHIPGATHLMITFDPQCSTDQGQDFLQLYKQPNKVEPILTSFSGKPENWPKIPIIVQGDQVFFHFHSAPFMTYWGYRCIVTGLILENSNVWLYDLYRTTGMLLKKCLKKTLLSTLLEEEKSFETLLDSQLFRGGVQNINDKEASFIEDFISNKEGSTANQIISSIEKKVPSNPMIDRIGGAVVTTCIRAFVITMIKHLGMFQMLLDSEITPETEEQLVKIWMEGRKLRQWIGGERRRILLEQEARKEELQEQEQQQGEAQSKEESEDKYTYEYFSADIVSKMRLLLNLAPATQATGFVTVGSELFTEERSKMKRSGGTGARSSLRTSQDNSLQTWKDLFTAWRNVQQMSQSQRAKKEGKKSKHEELLTSIPELISSFIKKGSVDKLNTIIKARIERASNRAKAFGILGDLLNDLRLVSVKQDLASVAVSVRLLKDTEDSGHYLCNLKGCGYSQENEVRSTFFRLYRYLMNILKDKEGDSLLRRIAVDVLTIGYRQEDHEFLLEVFPLLRRIMCGIDIDDNRLKSLCSLSYRFLSLYCVGNIREDENIAYSDSLDPLQKFVLELLSKDIEKTLENIKLKRAVLFVPNKEEDSRSVATYHREEKFLHEMLFLLNLCTQTPVSESYLCSTKILRLLIHTYQVSPLRDQRLVLRMLRRILPKVDASLFNDWDFAEYMGNTKLTDPIHGLVEYFFELIGEGVLVDSVDNPNPTPPSQNYRTGQVVFSLTSELVMLLRQLMSHPNWQKSISNTIASALKCLMAVIKENKNHFIKRIIAALSIIGGHTDTAIRIGGRVEVKSTKERATIVDYDRLSARCKVIMDTNPSKVIEIDNCSEKLIAVPEISFDPATFPLTAELIPAFTLFTDALLLASNAKHDQETQNSEASEKPTPEVKEELWDCSICTYKNLPKASSCSVCGSPRANDDSSSEDFLPWACLVCTLENTPSTTICVVCGTARPSSEKTDQKMVIEPTMYDEEMKDASQEDEQEETENVDLIYHLIRSKAVKALTSLLSHKPSAECLFKEGALASFVEMSVKPTELDEFKSIDQLEIKEERLWELLYQAKHTIKEDTMQKQLSQAELLSNSPFCSLPVILPSALDRGSAKNIVFPSSNDLTSVTRNKIFEDTFGLVRSNALVPVSIPAYYFEITLMKGDNSIEIEGGQRVAIGLYREGCELEGLPGNQNSYAYQGDRGQLCHNVGSLRTSRIVEREYGEAFGIGDVIGCGWNIKASTIWFTKNGKFLGNGFENVVGRFFPCIWLGSDVKISVNFGQQPYVFDFKSTLPSDFVASLATTQGTAKGMSAAELKRRTMAEELMVMMDIFPKELCIIALEKCRDDLQFAANWLLEHGFRELDRMMNETIKVSGEEQKVREEREVMKAIIEEQRALGQFTDPHNEPISTSNDANEDEIDENELEDYEFDSREPSARFLDDEIGVDAPVQIERGQRYAANEDMRIEDVHPGMLLSVSTGSSVDIIDTDNRTGVVTEVDLNSMRIQLRFFNSETCSIHSFWFQFQILKKPTHLYQDPCIEYKGSSISKLKSAISNLEAALSVLKVRRAVLNLISEWPSFPFDELAAKSPQNITDLLKLASSEFLASGIELGRNESNSILKSFHSKLGTLLRKESSIPPSPLRIKQAGSPVKGKDPKVSLTQILTEECIQHFVNAVDFPPPVITEESSHPYQNNQDVRKKFHIKGASRLVLRFDQSCNIHRQDPLTRLSFYRDEEYQDLIVTYRGSTAANQFQTIIVDSDKVWFRFTSGAGETFWGYKFTITPHNLRLNDLQALNGLNFELGYWLLELLLENGPDSVRKVYIKHLYNALVYYIEKSRRSAKARGIQLLLKVLQEVQQNASQHGNTIDLTHMLKLRPIMEKKYILETLENRVLYSAHLQGLVELLATAKLTETSLLQSTTTKSSTLPVTNIGMRLLKITKAKYGYLKNSKLCIDLTETLQQIVDTQFGGSYLVIPSKWNSFAPLFVDPAPGKDKKLSISYQIIDSITGDTIDKTKRVLGYGESTIIRPIDWFGEILFITEAVQLMNKSSSLPYPLVLETVAYEKLKKEFYWPLVNDLKLATETGIAIPHPGPYFGFTLSLFINISDTVGTTGQRTIITKGYSADCNRTPTLLFDAESKTLQLAVSTTRDWIEVLPSKKEIPYNTWVHVICWSDGKAVRLFLDGKMEVEKALKARMLQNRDPFYINKPPLGVQSADYNYDGIQGRIRKSRFYLRALDPNEIEQLFTEDVSTLEQDISFVPPSLTSSEVDHIVEAHSKWTHTMDEALVEMVAIFCDENDIDPFSIDLDRTNFTDELLIRYPSLIGVPAQIIHFRYAAIRIFNLKLLSVFPLIDFSQSHLPWSLAHLLTKLRGIIFLQTKLQLWNKILHNTASNRGRVQVTISRPRALKAKEKGDPEGKYSVFGQMYRQLHFVTPVHLRKAGQTWSVMFAGEGGQDAGGLFRDSISHVCSDLQSPYVPLFVPCPNSRGFGDNQEKWVPNPAATSSLQLSMYAFVGKLMGVAIRGKHVLNLDLPSILWKQLVGSDITRTDLEAIDALSYKVIDQVLNAEKQEGVTPDTFEDFFDFTFTTTSTDGREIELVEGGREKKVTWENRHEFAALLEKYKLNEFHAQIEAIKSGLATIVPIQLVSLFTWQELELSVCGKREVNIELLRQNTKYSGYQKTDPAVNMFWEVMKKLTRKERELFLRFVWGRSRLPLFSEDFEQKFVLMTAPENTDDTLPVSHTCFFQLELPRYSSEEIMKRKLLYAITECREIDTDHAAQNIDWDAEGD